MLHIYSAYLLLKSKFIMEIFFSVFLNNHTEICINSFGGFTWNYITFLLAFIIKLFVFSPFTLNPHDKLIWFTLKMSQILRGSIHVISSDDEINWKKTTCFSTPKSFMQNPSSNLINRILKLERSIYEGSWT